MLLIIACSRSGTQYMTRVLQEHGLAVRHEQNWDGIPGRGIHSVTPGTMAGEIGWVSLLRILVGLDSIRDYRPVLHMVRHPLLAIRSMQTHHYTLLEQLSNVLHFQTTTPLGKYMEYWLAWNQIAEHLAEYTFCIERFPYCYDEVCSRLGIAPISEVLLNVPTDLGHRLDEEPHWFEKDMTWEQLAEHGPDLAKRVRELANHYGYKAAPPRPVGPH